MNLVQKLKKEHVGEWTWKHTALLVKRWFDTGMALTTIPRMAMQLFAQIAGIGGILTGKGNYVEYAIISAAIYFGSCLVFGYIYHAKDWAHAESDVNNLFNPITMRMDKRIEQISDKLK